MGNYGFNVPVAQQYARGVALAFLCNVVVAAPLAAQTRSPNIVEFVPSPEHYDLMSATGARTVHISDLSFVSASSGWGPIERDMSNGEAIDGDGTMLTLEGVSHTKGLGVHAPSDITLTLPSGCTSFSAFVGVDDEVGANGSVSFQVLADGVLLYDSGVLTGSSATRPVSLDVRGRTALRLTVQDGGDNNWYDHADWADAKLTCSTDQPVVSSYHVAFYQAGASDPFMLLDVGKPAPLADGLIRVDFGSRISAWPIPNANCELRVVAVGTGGVSVSYPSNTFVFPCAFALSSSGQAFSGSGGSGAVQLVAEAYCGWTAGTSATWIGIVSGASGTGPGSVSFTVASNTTGMPRTGTITVAGLTYTVTQSATTPAPDDTGLPNVPPAVSITRPSADTLLKHSVRIDAAATDSDGSVVKVRFFANGTYIGESTTAPYTLRWSPQSTGAFNLTAMAVDNAGATATSSSVPVRVR